ncbi:MAG: 4Fe-4S binding protein, partial [Promethearchaeota archaeon]
CGTCVKKCPMNAIFHRFPIEEDLSDEKILIKYDICIGCGVCAVNCSKNAISMEKVRESPPLDLKNLGLENFDLNLFSA